MKYPKFGAAEETSEPKGKREEIEPGARKAKKAKKGRKGKLKAKKPMGAMPGFAKMMLGGK